jgi:hypothetical protein
MPVLSQKVRKKLPKPETLSNQTALDFAQLILDIYKEKKEL